MDTWNNDYFERVELITQSELCACGNAKLFGRPECDRCVKWWIQEEKRLNPIQLTERLDQ